jgi:hypothetical protein
VGSGGRQAGDLDDRENGEGHQDGEGEDGRAVSAVVEEK